MNTPDFQSQYPSTVPCVVALGSNIGHRQANLENALARLQHHPHIRNLTCSSVIETDPVGYLDQPSFLNAVATFETSLSAENLLRTLLAIEQDMGRERTIRWGPRLIDLDLIFYADEIVTTPWLTVPHPRMHERLFVLEPLTEIHPDWMHPLKQQTVRELRDQLLSQAAA